MIDLDKLMWIILSIIGGGLLVAVLLMATLER